MPYEHKPNSGTLFQREKTDNEKSPTDTGDALIDCPHCNRSIWVKLAGWFKQGEQGKSNRINLKTTCFKSRAEMDASKQAKSGQPQPRQPQAINPPSDPNATDVPF